LQANEQNIKISIKQTVTVLNALWSTKAPLTRDQK